MHNCIVCTLVASLYCGWVFVCEYMFSYVELYQMTYCIGHKHELFLCCGLPCDLSELLHDRITSGILNTCASCRSNLSRFWRGVRPLSLVIFVKLNDLKLSLSIAETCQAFNFVDRLLTLLLFFRLICWNACWRWPKEVSLEYGEVSPYYSITWGVKGGVNCWKH